MLNAARAAALVVILAAGAGFALNQGSPSPGVATASPDPSPIPASPSPTPGAAAVTGRFTYNGDQEAAPGVTFTDGVQHWRGERWSGIDVDSSDPRLAGVASFAYERDVHPGGVGVVWGTTEIVNEAGGWAGRTFGPILPGPSTSWQNAFRLTGTGAHEGWSALLIVEADGTFEGVIIPGPLPDEG